MDVVLPEYVLQCLKSIESAGFEAWCVGGCVRDMLMGRRPNDFDIATSAAPETICGLFPRHFCTGMRFGTITVLIGEEQLEVTTFRTDGGYCDHRRPETVCFSNSLKEDVSRRDFTINAMAYHPQRGLYDFYDGQRDLAQKMIRAVGDASLRFEEDALRILRAYRFASQLDFTLEDKTRQAALCRLPLLRTISGERVTEEIRKALLAKRPSRLSALVYGADLSALNQVPCSFSMRLAAFCILSRMDNSRLLERLRLSKQEQRELQAVLRQLGLALPGCKAELKRRFSVLPPEQWEQLLATYTIIYNKDTRAVQRFLKEVQEREEPWNIAALAINGEDLIRAGISAGPEIGIRLNQLLELVIEHPQYNTKRILLERL